MIFAIMTRAHAMPPRDSRQLTDATGFRDVAQRKMQDAWRAKSSPVRLRKSMRPRAHSHCRKMLDTLEDSKCRRRHRIADDIEQTRIAECAHA